MNPIAIVTDFCAAWDRLDRDAIIGALTPDIFYHNIPMEPVRGIAEFQAFMDNFTVSQARFEIHHIAAQGNVVLTERTDYLVFGGKNIVLRVMGAFETRGEKIAVWRDYFDMAQYTSQLTAS